MAIADMNPGMSPWFTVISLVVSLLLTTSPCSGYFLTRLHPRDAVSKSMTDARTSRDFVNLMFIPFLPSLRAPLPWRSVVEPVSHLHIDFARQVPVISAEGQAVIFLDAVVGYVERGQGRGEAFAEILPERKIEGGVLRQIRLSRIGGS